MIWKIRDKANDFMNFKEYIAKIRGIEDINEYLNPSVKNLHSPLLLKNINKAVERVDKAVENDEKIVVVADVDFDGIASTVIMMDYLKRLTKNVSYIYHERSEGHGISYDEVPSDTDLLIILDSSSSETEECKKLSKAMDIIIIDHHLISQENPYCILVNPMQDGCEYPNKETCATLLAFKFVELMDYKYKKVNTDKYFDLVGAGLLADVVAMDVLENRYFVKQALRQVNNIGLLALLREKKIDHRNLKTTNFTYDINPIISTATRNDEIEKAFSLLFETDFRKARQKAKKLIEDNEVRKEKLDYLLKRYDRIIDLGKVGIVISKEASKNYNGLVAGKLASKYKRPILVLKDNGGLLQGSARSYGGFDFRSFLLESNLVNYAAGHSEAFGIEIDSSRLDDLKAYIEGNLDDSMFEPIIIYDIELEEDDIDWDIVEKITEFDLIHGRNSPPIKVKLSNFIVDERQLFPKTQKHVKIITEHIDILKFNDSEYANDVDTFDFIDAVGTLSVNEFLGNKRINLIVEDYKKVG